MRAIAVGAIAMGWMVWLGILPAVAEESRLCVVQFIHPGLEHEPDSETGRSWNTAMHRRKFLQWPGAYLSAVEGQPVPGELLFWGEFEPPTRLVRKLDAPGRDWPQYLFAPAYTKFTPHDPPFMNTDPFVYGDRFFYSICKQNNRHGPTSMQRLARGSVILFGSGRARARFVVDTVFVVADWVDWTPVNFRQRLHDEVPPEYINLSLEAIVYELQVRGLADKQTFRLYRGATVDQPVDGMFSFFPCRPSRGQEARGFERPTIRLPGIVTDNLTQGQRYNPQPDVESVRELWLATARQVLEQGLYLGTHADLPIAQPQSDQTGP